MRALTLATAMVLCASWPAEARDPPGAYFGATGGSSGDVGNAQAQASLPATPNLTEVLTGVEVTAAGATSGGCVAFTIAGLVGGTMIYAFCVPAPASAEAPPLILSFPNPLIASGPNVAITATLPALGSGNAHAAVNIHGYLIQ